MGRLCGVSSRGSQGSSQGSRVAKHPGHTSSQGGGTLPPLTTTAACTRCPQREARSYQGLSSPWLLAEMPTPGTLIYIFVSRHSHCGRSQAASRQGRGCAPTNSVSVPRTFVHWNPDPVCPSSPFLKPTATPTWPTASSRMLCAVDDGLTPFLKPSPKWNPDQNSQCTSGPRVLQPGPQRAGGCPVL